MLPDVAELELVETVAGLRPGTPDNAPLIGPRRGRRPACSRRATSATGSCSRRSPPTRSPRPSRARRSMPHSRSRRAAFDGGGDAMMIELNGAPAELPDRRHVADAVAAAGAERGATRSGGRGRRRGRARASGSRHGSARGPGRRGREGGAGWLTSELAQDRAAAGARARRAHLGLAPDRRHRRLPLARGDGAGARGVGDGDRHRRPAPRRSARRRARCSTWSSAWACSACRTRPGATRRATRCGRRSSLARPSRPTGSSSR